MEGAHNLALVDTYGELIEDDWFVPWLLASVWSRAFVTAARHGLPALRSDVCETGLAVKGRIDVAATGRLRGSGVTGVVSLRRHKSLDNAIVAAIVAGHAALVRALGRRPNAEWLPERIKDLLPHLTASVGSRPVIPSDCELHRVRLTPITERFRGVAHLSVRIARGRGLSGNSSDTGDCKGVLLDVAELWELYVLAVLRRAWPALQVAHGTHESSDSRALLSNVHGNSLGILKPDAVIKQNGAVEIIVDAKYKRIGYSSWNPSPQREDLYQLAAYLGRYREPARPIAGFLAYPSESAEAGISAAEAGNPWRLDPNTEIRFISLPHDIDDAVMKMRQTRHTRAAAAELNP
jgi:5-methylcytosine-specific restriction enzyme subunit McrC